MTSFDRDPCRRPITDEERPHLLELGRRLRYWRQRAGLTQAALADALAMAELHIWRIEKARRRTRRSTLREIAAVIASSCRQRGDGVNAADVLAEFLTAGGPGIAPESPKSDGSVRRKRKRRRRENLKHDLALIRQLVDGPDAEPVSGGPELFLRRRVNAAMDRL